MASQLPFCTLFKVFNFETLNCLSNWRDCCTSPDFLCCLHAHMISPLCSPQRSFSTIHCCSESYSQERQNATRYQHLRARQLPLTHAHTKKKQLRTHIKLNLPLFSPYTPKKVPPFFSFNSHLKTLFFFSNATNAY